MRRPHLQIQICNATTGNKITDPTWLPGSGSYGEGVAKPTPRGHDRPDPIPEKKKRRAGKRQKRDITVAVLGA